MDDAPAGHGEDGSNIRDIVFRHSQKIIRQDREVRVFSGLECTFDVFFEAQPSAFAGRAGESFGARQGLRVAEAFAGLLGLAGDDMPDRMKQGWWYIIGGERDMNPRIDEIAHRQDAVDFRCAKVAAELFTVLIEPAVAVGLQDEP